MYISKILGTLGIESLLLIGQKCFLFTTLKLKTWEESCKNHQDASKLEQSSHPRSQLFNKTTYTPGNGDRFSVWKAIWVPGKQTNSSHINFCILPGHSTHHLKPASKGCGALIMEPDLGFPASVSNEITEQNQQFNFWQKGWFSVVYRISLRGVWYES